MRGAFREETRLTSVIESLVVWSPPGHPGIPGPRGLGSGGKGPRGPESGLVFRGLTPQQQPGSYQGGGMMMMKSVFWWRKPEYPEETTDLRQVTA